METTPRRNDRVLSQSASGTLVLLDVDSGVYYSLEQVGARAWELIDGSRTVGQIVECIGEEYDAARDEIERDVESLVAELALANLVDRA